MALHRSHVEKGYKLHYNGLYYPTMADNWGTLEIQREEVGGGVLTFQEVPCGADTFHRILLVVSKRLASAQEERILIRHR